MSVHSNAHYVDQGISGCDRIRSLNVLRVFSDAWTRLASSTSRKSGQWQACPKRSRFAVRIALPNVTGLDSVRDERLAMLARDIPDVRQLTPVSHHRRLTFPTHCSEREFSSAINAAWKDLYRWRGWFWIRQNCPGTNEVVDDEQLQIGNANQRS